jgi:PAS domain S-box-containing protein
MIRSQEKRVDIGIILVIVSIITIAIFSFLQNQKANTVSSRIDYTQNILQQLSGLYNTVIEHAGAARSYALNGNEKEIAMIKSTGGDLLLRLDRLKKQIKNNAGLWTQSDSLTKYIHKRVAFSDTIIAAGKEQGLAAASDIYNTGMGRDYNNLIFSFIQKMQDNELNTLKQDEQKNAVGIRQLGYSLIALLVFLLVLIIIIIQKIRMDNVLRRQTEQQLKQFNKILEEKVRIKTADIKESEMKLEASENNLRQVLSSATENFYVIDKSYRVTLINEVAERNLQKAWGHPVTTGTNILDYAPDEKNEPSRKSFEKAFDGEKVEYEIYLSIEGLPEWVQVNYMPVNDENGITTGVCVFTTDITSRKKAEEIVKASEERYRSLIEQASDAIMITDSKGNFSEVNQVFCKKFGYEKEEVKQMNISMVIDPEQLKKEPIHFAELLAGQTILSERRMLHKDGTIIEVEANVKMIPDGRLLAIARDIGERKKTEQEKERIRYELNERVKELTTLYRAGQILQAEDKSTDAVLKEIISILPSGWQYPDITAARVVLGEKEFTTANFAESIHKQNSLFQTFDGTPGKLEVIYLENRPPEAEGPFLIEERNLLNMLAEMLQIYFNRKWANEQLKQSYEEIRLLASHIEDIREEEKIKIAREIHDELGQQITSLKIDVSWLSKKLEPDNEILYKKTKDVLLLLDETVKSVRRIASELRPGILDDLGLVAAIEWQSNEFEKRSGIKTQFNYFPDDFVTPKNISTGLFRIFQESLTNVARHAEASEIVVSINRTGNGVILKISDNGKGFDLSTFGQKRTLGLLGMKERTMMMGGKYDIFSEKGKGTTVFVTVPLKEF